MRGDRSRDPSTSANPRTSVATTMPRPQRSSPRRRLPARKIPAAPNPSTSDRQDPAQRVEESDRALRMPQRRGVEELVAQRERPDREFVEDADAALRQVRAQRDRDRREIDRDPTVLRRDHLAATGERLLRPARGPGGWHRSTAPGTVGLEELQRRVLRERLQARPRAARRGSRSSGGRFSFASSSTSTCSNSVFVSRTETALMTSWFSASGATVRT